MISFMEMLKLIVVFAFFVSMGTLRSSGDNCRSEPEAWVDEIAEINKDFS